MKCNIGNSDKKIRIFLGVLLIAISFVTKSWLLGIIGSISLITGFTRFCLLYVPFKINTDKK